MGGGGHRVGGTWTHGMSGAPMPCFVPTHVRSPYVHYTYLQTHTCMGISAGSITYTDARTLTSKKNCSRGHTGSRLWLITDVMCDWPCATIQETMPYDESS